jgi:hypothetical protein
MKKLLLGILILVCFSSISKAQPVLGTDYFYKLKGSNEYTFYLFTSFSFGSGGGCPNMNYVKIEKSNDTIYLKAVYDARGAWAAMGCDDFDSIKYTYTDMTINYINVSTNIAKFASDYVHTDTTWNLFDSTFLVGKAGIKNQSNASGFSIYPNPSNGKMIVSASNIPKGVIKASIYDVLGRLVYQSTLSFKDNKAELLIPTNSSAVYILELKEESGSVYRERLVME